jgi:putative ABC transport system permease protein
MSELLHDIRYAVRSLKKSTGFTLVTVLTLALGIGANTAIFGVVDAVLLETLPAPEPDELVQVFETSESEKWTVSPPNFTDWRAQSTVFEEMAAHYADSFALSGGGAAESVLGEWVTAGFFRVLGREPLLGRAFTPADTVVGRDRVVVLSHALWQRRFGGRPDVLGRSIELEGESRTVVGVMPPGFAFPAEAELWVPLAFTPEDLGTQRGAHYLDVLARLRDGVTIEQASTELTLIARRLEAQYPDTNAGAGVAVVGLQEALTGGVRPALLILLGAVGLVLLIACANVANLLLARAAERRRELALRSALGAGSGRILRAGLTESLVLALLGGAAGLALALAALEVLVASPPAGVPRIEDARIDLTVLGFTLGLSLLTGLLFGLAPAVKAARTADLGRALREGGAGSVGGSARSRGRNALVVAEMALAVLLLVGAGLLLKSFVELQVVDSGFDPQGVLSFHVSLPETRYPEPRQSRAFFAGLLERIRSLPGVDGAAGVFGLPLSGFSYSMSVEVLDGAPAYERPGEEKSTQLRVVTPGYFDVMRIPLVAGRPLTERDREEAPLAVVVNESAARLLWPDDAPLGHTLELATAFGLGGPRAGGTVVGVVRDIRHRGPREASRPEVFLAHAQFPVDFMSVTVRTSVPPESLVNPIRGELQQLDPELPMDSIRTMEQRLADSIAEPRFYMLLLSAFAASALFLASIGIYGVIAYAVKNRVAEIGIRRALGARAGDVVRMVVGGAVALALGGLAAGLLAALALTRILSGLLYGVSATDPLTFAGVAIVLLAVALLASFIPARRAARVDPMTALREE